MYNFYIELIGVEGSRWDGLAHNFWGVDCQDSPEDNEMILLAFSEEDDLELKAMKTDTTLGLDGFPVAFFKCC